MKRALDLAFLGGLSLIYLALGWALWCVQSDEAHLIGLVSYAGGVLCLVGMLLSGMGFIDLDVISWQRWRFPGSRPR